MTTWLGAARFSVIGILSWGCAHKTAPLGRTDPPRPADTFIATIEIMKHSVAPVICLDGDSPQATLQHLEGTAFFVSRTGEFLTAAHVLDGIKDHSHACPVAAIYLPPDRWDPEPLQEVFAWYPFAAGECEFHRDVDVAKCRPFTDLTLRGDKASFEIRPVRFEWSSQPDGTLIAFTGFPLESRDPLTSRGEVAAYRRASSADMLDLIIDQAAWPGASGAPVYLADGRVIGMVVARGTGEGTGIAVVRPARFLQRALERGPRLTEPVGARTSLLPR